MKRVLITGIGLVGKQLAALLSNQGYDVCFLSRTSRSNFGYKIFHWELKSNYIDLNALTDTHYIIHLAGANLGDKRWTKKRKKELENSRIHSTLLLFNTIKEHQINIKGYIGASAIGYYGATTTSTIYAEDMDPGNDYIGQFCNEWENAHLKFKQLNIPVNIIRIGIVLSHNGGALPKIMNPIKNGFGASIGTGKQFMPWIHIIDLCKIIMLLLNSNSDGIYNLVATEHINNHDLTKLIADKLNKKIFLPNIPEFILKAILGEMAVLISNGSRISNLKIKTSLNYSFKFDTIDKALDDLIKVSH